MTWKDDITLHVDVALGFGVFGADEASLKLAIGTSSAGVSDARIGYGAIGSTQTAGYFTIGSATYGKIGVAGRIPGDGADEAAFTALEGYARSVLIRRNKPSRYSAYDTGTCSITFHDESRDLDPLNLDGPYVVNSTTLLTRGRRVRISADWGGARRALFTGFVDSWPSQLDMFEAATRQIECVDWFGLLALFDGYEQTPTVGANETVTARIHRLLDLAEVPYLDRDIGTSTVTCQATNLSGNLLQNLRAAAQADGGHIWVSPDGKVTFRSKVEIWSANAANNVVWTLSNDGSAYAARAPLYAGVPQVRESDAYSIFYLTRNGGSTQIVFDSTLKDRIGPIVYEEGGLISASDTEALNLATYLLNSQPRSEHYQVVGATIRPDVHAYARDMAFNANPFDRVNVKYRYPVPGLAQIDRQALLTGVEHEITPTTWQTRYALEDVTGYGAFRIGVSAIGGDDFIP